MKCPKCGYNSFEYYDICKKCSSDLTGYKQTYSITSMVLPLEAKEKLTDEYRAAIITSTEEIEESPRAEDDMFSFDMPDEPAAVSTHQNDDPFNFAESSSFADQSGDSKPEDVSFGDLLETISQAEESPFAAAIKETAPAAAEETADLSSGLGEFALGGFSWDDTSAAPAVPADATVPSEAENKGDEDDFASIFGDLKTTGSK